MLVLSSIVSLDLLILPPTFTEDNLTGGVCWSLELQSGEQPSTNIFTK